MKLLYLHQYFKFPDESGGTRSYDLATGFVENGISVEIISATSNPEYRDKKRWYSVYKDGLTIHFLYLPYENNYSYLRRSYVFLLFAFYTTFKLLSLKADLVIATSTPITIGIPTIVKKLIHKTPYIFEVRDVWPEAVIAFGVVNNWLLKKILFRLEKLIYKYASAIVPLSIDMKESIVGRYPIFNKKPIVVIENISEIKRFHDYQHFNKSIIYKYTGENPRFSILYAGTFGKVNQIEYVISLAESIIDYDASIIFILIGNGAQKVSIIKLANEKKVLNKNLFILNHVSKQELPELYRACSMGSSFLVNIKELWANSANKFFDTLASGKPILINYQGWQKDIIIEKNIGFVLPHELTKESIIKFVEYTHNEELIAKQRINAFKLAKENYSLEIALKKYLNIIHIIIDKSL